MDKYYRIPLVTISTIVTFTESIWCVPGAEIWNKKENVVNKQRVSVFQDKRLLDIG